ncbi:MAG: hypothetical protein V2B20_23700 [Pseudomonadota bacterium]
MPKTHYPMEAVLSGNVDRQNTIAAIAIPDWVVVGDASFFFRIGGKAPFSLPYNRQHSRTSATIKSRTVSQQCNSGPELSMTENRRKKNILHSFQ